MIKRIRHFFLQILLIFVFAVVGFFCIHKFVGEVNKVSSESMMNTILIGDYILINKMVYGALIPTDVASIPFLSLWKRNEWVKTKWKKWAEKKERLPGYGQVCRGDMIVFEGFGYEDPKVKMIKRVVALPGDTLTIVDGDVCINGIHRKEEEGVRLIKKGIFCPPVPFPSKTEWTLINYGPLIIPPDCYFVLGDNRGNSQDSRFYGFVHRSGIIGKGSVLKWMRKLLKVEN